MRLEVRKARKLLRKAGFKESGRSSHEVWRHPDGRMIALPRSKGDLFGELAHRILAAANGKITTRDRRREG